MQYKAFSKGNVSVTIAGGEDVALERTLIKNGYIPVGDGTIEDEDLEEVVAESAKDAEAAKAAEEAKTDEVKKANETEVPKKRGNRVKKDE